METKPPPEPPMDPQPSPASDSRRALLQRLLGLGLTQFSVGFVGAGLSKGARADGDVDTTCGTPDGGGGIVRDLACAEPSGGTFLADAACGQVGNPTTGVAEADGCCAKQNSNLTDTQDSDCGKNAGWGSHEDSDCHLVKSQGELHKDNDCGTPSGGAGGAVHQDDFCSTQVGPGLVAHDGDCSKPSGTVWPHTDFFCYVTSMGISHADHDCGLPPTVGAGLTSDYDCGKPGPGASWFHNDHRCTLNTPEQNYKDYDCGKMGPLQTLESDDDCSYQQDEQASDADS